MISTRKSALEVAGEEMNQGATAEVTMELGRLVGAAQISGYIARQCSYAEAQMLKRIKDSGAYKQFGEWEEFCPRYLGVSRNTADRIVKNLEAFGQEFFAISQFVRLSPDTFSHLQITDGKLLIGGEEVAVAKANESRIKAHIQQVQKELAQERESHGRTKGVLTKTRDEAKAAKQEADSAKQQLDERDRPQLRWQYADEDHALLLTMQAELDFLVARMSAFARREIAPENQTRAVAFAKYAWAAVHQAGDLLCGEYGAGLNAPVPAEWLDVDVATSDRRDLVAEYNEAHLKR